MHIKYGGACQAWLDPVDATVPRGCSDNPWRGHREKKGIRTLHNDELPLFILTAW